MNDELLTIKEAAQILRCHPITLRRYCNERRIKHYRNAGKSTIIHLKKSDVIAFFESNAVDEIL